MTALRVGGIEIPQAEILAELQYHPAPSAAGAMANARRALTARLLLRSEARRRGLGDGQDAIDRLLEGVLEVPAADEASCRAFHERHRARFVSPGLAEAQHILIAADPADEAARGVAQAKACALLEEVERTPDRFGALARAHSDCPSRESDGMLGQISPGGTVPEFETYLFSLEPGEICATPVPSRYGFHVLRCLAREEGRELPYAHVRGEIARRLEAAAWRRALAAFLDELATAAGVEGLDADLRDAA